MSRPARIIAAIVLLVLGSGCEKKTIVGPGPTPSLVVSPDTLAFSDTDSQKTVYIAVDPPGTLSWRITSKPSWLSAAPESGSVGSTPIPVVLTASATGLTPGTYHGAVSLISSGGAGHVGVSFLVTAGHVAASPDSLLFDYFVDAGSFIVSNTGDAPLTWTASGQSYLSLQPSSGSLGPGQQTTVNVTLNRTSLVTGTYTSSIQVQSDEGSSDVVGVRVMHYSETKWLLDAQITDAEFSPALNRIVAVSDAGLQVLDPEARTVQTIALPLPPTCVSVRADSAFAAVGHDGFVTYVDLGTMAIVKTYAITTDALDVVLAPRGWVYVFPKRDQWEYIHCLELSTGLETESTGRQIYAGMVGRLHPSGDYLYGADNNISPPDYDKFDVRSGTASFLYDSPYHGDYGTGIQLWFSESGDRIFGATGDVFRSTTNSGTDMTYNGHLAGLGIARWIEHSAAANRIFGLSADGGITPASSEIRMYGSDFLAYQGAIALPPFLVPNGSGGGTLYGSKGQFVFCNQSGTRLYTLVRAASGSGLLDDWALVALDVPPVP